MSNQKQTHSGGVSVSLLAIFIIGSAFGSAMTVLVRDSLTLRTVDLNSALNLVMMSLFGLLSFLMFVVLVRRLNKGSVSEWRVK
jgi:hypothetical protein